MGLCHFPLRLRPSIGIDPVYGVLHRILNHVLHKLAVLPHGIAHAILHDVSDKVWLPHGQTHGIANTPLEGLAQLGPQLRIELCA
jgi:hypothetical protein